MSKPKTFKGETLPTAKYKGVCVQVIDVGTQTPTNPKWNPAHLIYLVFELIGRKMKTGQPFLLQMKMTFSASKKGNLGKIMKSWLGVKNVGDYDMADALGQGGMLHVEPSDSGYNNITDITPFTGGKVPATETEHVSLFLDDTFDQETFDALPDHFKEKIAKSPEYDEVADQNPKKKSGKGKGK